MYTFLKLNHEKLNVASYILPFPFLQVHPN